MKNNLDQKKDMLCALVLAAGYSSRMGAFKPLLPIDDVTAIERILSTLKGAGIERPLVVTGHKKELILPIIEQKEARSIYNENYSQGMFSSIKKGLNTLFRGSLEVPSGALLMLADAPLIPAEVIQLLYKKHKENPDSFIVPCYLGKKGHPLLIPARYVKEILDYEGDGGLKAITSKYEDKIIRMEVDWEGVVLDMDTPENYHELLAYYEKSKNKGQKGDLDWKTLIGRRRIFFVRHGEIRQHKEKIFLGQTDIPLSEKGKEQGKEAARKLQEYLLINPTFHASDLIRTSETANIIMSNLENEALASCAYHSDLREMNLGEWDGKYIREIKEKYPKEYRKRGENILTYKYGNNSENFYDLQYRVMKCFRKIIEYENKANPQGDLIIVAHSGVIKVILSNLYKRDLLEEIKGSIPLGGVIAFNY